MNESAEYTFFYQVTIDADQLPEEVTLEGLMAAGATVKPFMPFLEEELSPAMEIEANL
jgi:hypothetical protein